MSLKQCCAYGPCAITKDLKACAACNEVMYCTKEHQTEHFKHGGHKMICPGRTKGPPLGFQECVEKAHKHHTDGSWRVALPYYSAMLELTERKAGVFHPQAAKILEAMTTCFSNMERFDDAAACLQRALVIKEMDNPQNNDPEKNRGAFLTMGRLAEVYLTAGNVDLAKQIMEKTETAAKESFGVDSFERGRALCALGGCQERLGDADGAVTTLRSALEVDAYIKASSPQELMTASTCPFNLGIILLNQEKYQEAKELLNKSIEMKTQAGLSSSHADIAEIREFLAKIDSAMA